MIADIVVNLCRPSLTRLAVFADIVVNLYWPSLSRKTQTVSLTLAVKLYTIYFTF